MNTNTASKKLSAPDDGASDLAVLDNRLRELQARRAAVIETIIVAEKSLPASGDSTDAERAQALLAGGKFIASRERPIPQLVALRDECSLLDQALQLGLAKRDNLAREVATKIWASHRGAIERIERRRVTLALQLQSVNRQREELREHIKEAGGSGFLTTDSVALLADSAEEIEWAVARLIADGVCTRRELEKESANG
jgi:hypothetical protein